MYRGIRNMNIGLLFYKKGKKINNNKNLKILLRFFELKLFCILYY